MKKQIRILISILAFIIIIPLNASAQDSTAVARDSTAVIDSSKINRKYFYKALAYESAFYVGAMLVMQDTWYKNRALCPLHFDNDNSGYLQMDKFGHAFGAYLESYIGYNWLRNSGMTKKQALIYGGTLGFILQAPIEIMDGIHEGWGFSWGDLTANTVGSALFIGQQLLFDEQLVKYKFSFWESEYADKANGYLGTSTLQNVLQDYNGHNYWFSIPINKIVPNKILPDWLCISLGYGANGMYGEYWNITEHKGVSIPQTTRYRQYLLSLDIDWTKIKTRSKFLKVVLQGLTFIKLPFPTLEYNSMGKFQGYWMYY
ncbi:MAG: DUF2279 domain-containing protein [bacterium]